MKEKKTQILVFVRKIIFIGATNLLAKREKKLLKSAQNFGEKIKRKTKQVN
ncbi:hypothetical protein D3C72_1104470 [compost metagenome]